MSQGIENLAAGQQPAALRNFQSSSEASEASNQATVDSPGNAKGEDTQEEASAAQEIEQEQGRGQNLNLLG